MWFLPTTFWSLDNYIDLIIAKGDIISYVTMSQQWTSMNTNDPKNQQNEKGVPMESSMLNNIIVLQLALQMDQKHTSWHLLHCLNLSAEETYSQTAAASKFCEERWITRIPAFWCHWNGKAVMHISWTEQGCSRLVKFVTIIGTLNREGNPALRWPKPLTPALNMSMHNINWRKMVY